MDINYMGSKFENRSLIDKIHIVAIPKTKLNSLFLINHLLIK